MPDVEIHPTTTDDAVEITSPPISPLSARLLPCPVPLSRLATASLHADGADCSCCDDVPVDELLFIQVPGAHQIAYISRQVLLAQIASSLGLRIHSTEVITESTSGLRAWIEIDIVPSVTDMLGSKQRFYSAIRKTIYSAMEDVAETVITYLLHESHVIVNDANYKQTVMLQKKLAVAMSFQDIYKDHMEATLQCLASIRECNRRLLHEIQQICIEHASILPLAVRGIHRTVMASNDISVQYTGQTPPVSMYEKLAFRLAHLNSANAIGVVPSRGTTARS